LFAFAATESCCSVCKKRSSTRCAIRDICSVAFRVESRQESVMSNTKRYTGGCLCGALRYEAVGEPAGTGHCYCTDCQKASGSGFIPFMGFPADAVRFSGESKRFVSKAARGGDAERNSCPVCSSLVFGGIVGQSASFTIYAGSLDDP